LARKKSKRRASSHARCATWNELEAAQREPAIRTRVLLHDRARLAQIQAVESRFKRALARTPEERRRRDAAAVRALGWTRKGGRRARPWLEALHWYVRLTTTDGVSKKRRIGWIDHAAIAAAAAEPTPESERESLRAAVHHVPGPVPQRRLDQHRALDFLASCYGVEPRTLRDGLEQARRAARRSTDARLKRVASQCSLPPRDRDGARRKRGSVVTR